jgi:hypothetical protein
MPSEDFETDILPELRRAIPQTLSADHREALRGRFAYLNEYSLARRLKHLCLEFEEPLRAICGNKAPSPRALADLRNELTHYSKAKSGHVNARRLFWSLEYALLLLKFCFLREAGLSIELISALARSRPRFEAQRRWWQSDAVAES